MCVPRNNGAEEKASKRKLHLVVSAVLGMWHPKGKIDFQPQPIFVSSSIWKDHLFVIDHHSKSHFDFIFLQATSNKQQPTTNNQQPTTKRQQATTNKREEPCHVSCTGCSRSQTVDRPSSSTATSLACVCCGTKSLRKAVTHNATGTPSFFFCFFRLPSINPLSYFC